MTPVSLPRNPTEVDVAIDREQVFLLYATFTGDVEKVGHAINMRPIDVLRMADEDGWADKLKPILELKKSSKPGDFERGVNRALNFVQARRLWLFLERVMSKVTGMSEEELKEYLFTGDQFLNKDGTVQREVKKLSTRALADLAAAIEKCQALTYLALNDTAQDRNRRKEQASSEEDAGDLGVRIAKSMAAISASNSPRAQLFDVKLNLAEQTAKPVPIAPEPVVHPNDSDEH